MRAFGIFFSGFAAGVVFLAGLLWATHSLQVIKASGPPAPAAVARIPAARPTATETLPAPPSLPDQNTPATGAPPVAAHADLLLPVEGMTAGELRDNFQEARNGHLHEALDIMAPRGTPVLAVAEGNIVKLFHSKPGGLTVYQFDDSRNWCFYYAHLDHYAKGLIEGTLARKGDVLGYVGVTGNAPPNAPHLHFTIFKLGPEKEWWKGTVLDPYPFLTGQKAWPPS